LGNLIPEWNDHVFRGAHDRAASALLETNSFPEITGRVCPAPCEASCVLNLEQAPVTIKSIERAIADELMSRPLVPQRAAHSLHKRVAVVGSGPAGLAAAQELVRLGYDVTVFERDARPGGLLRYGIPDFKLERSVLDRRISQIEAEGARFRCGHSPSAQELGVFEGVVIATGARRPRNLEVPGRELEGVHFAMDFLSAQNRRVSGEARHDAAPHLLAHNRHVVVLGGGDTGSDCVGTSLRQGAASVVSLELMPAPPLARAAQDLWPNWPNVFRSSSSHEEGGERLFALRTEAFMPDASGKHVAAIRVTEIELQHMSRDASAAPLLRVVAGSERVLRADLVLLAMGFVGAEAEPWLGELGVHLDARGRVQTIDGLRTHVRGVVACGDAYRGASLVVWAIADGRRAAAELHAVLTT
jgi:glutamate synthase (NADPH/NADH) small chain